MDLFVARASRMEMFNNSFTAFQFSGFPFPGLGPCSQSNTKYRIYRFFGRTTRTTRSKKWLIILIHFE